jgi:hypothetical protein
MSHDAAEVIGSSPIRSVEVDMKSGNQKSGLLNGRLGIAMALVILVAAPKFGGRAQETPPGTPPAKPAGRPDTPDSPDSIDQRVADLEAIVAAQHEEIERLSRVCAGLVEGSAMIATAAEQALIKGFVEAGANPDARTELLNGLSSFADTVKLAAEPPKKDAPVKK